MLLAILGLVETLVVQLTVVDNIDVSFVDGANIALTRILLDWNGAVNSSDRYAISSLYFVYQVIVGYNKNLNGVLVIKSQL